MRHKCHKSVEYFFAGGFTGSPASWNTFFFVSYVDYKYNIWYNISIKDEDEGYGRNPQVLWLKEKDKKQRRSLKWQMVKLVAKE